MDFLKDLELDDEIKTKITDGLKSAIDSEVMALKLKNDELLQEKQKLSAKKQEELEQARLNAEQKAKESGDFKNLFESQKQEADTLKQQLADMQTNIQKQQINGEAAKMAARLTKDTNKAQLLQQQISQRLTLVDNELRVTDDNGQPTISTVDDLANSIKTAYPFLVDGTQANGGGATRSQASGDAVAKTMTRADFDGLGQAQRAQFFKDGGKISDE
jgi:5'-3' exonuclease